MFTHWPPCGALFGVVTGRPSIKDWTRSDEGRLDELCNSESESTDDTPGCIAKDHSSGG